MPVPIRAAITSLPPYRAGKLPTPGPDGASYKLSSNENPFPPLPGVLDAVARAATGMNRYPDPGNQLITEAVAARHGVGTDRIAFGAGSVAVIYHLLQATCGVGDEVIYAWRSFEAYPIAVQLTGATAVQVPLAPGAVHDLDAMRAAVTDATKVIMVCTPNNPTGPVVDHEALMSFVDSVPDHIMIIIDEAYVEFVTDPRAARGLEIAATRDNVVVLRTFSKAFGLAGFRVGYAVAPPALAAATRAASLPFGVSVTAQAAVLASLDAEAELLERVATLVERREQTVTAMRDLGFDIPASQGNFFWLPGGPSTQRWSDTLTDAGVAVRAFATEDQHAGLRITVAEPAANQRVLEVAASLDR